MKVFLDECIDWRLAREISDHEVRTAKQMGWASIKNGELLKLVATRFDVFVTVDRNLTFQQNIGIHNVAVIVLRAKSNRLAELTRLIPHLLQALDKQPAPGGVVIVDGRTGAA